jgi:hypothetical protein
MNVKADGINSSTALQRKKQSSHVNRVSPANTVKNEKRKTSYFVVPWYSMHWNTGKPMR